MLQPPAFRQDHVGQGLQIEALAQDVLEGAVGVAGEVAGAGAGGSARKRFCFGGHRGVGLGQEGPCHFHLGPCGSGKVLLQEFQARGSMVNRPCHVPVVVGASCCLAQLYELVAQQGGISFVQGVTETF